MIFTIIIIAIVGIVTFFHYVQGFFSATLSAILTVIAAVLAVSYHESVVESVMGAKAAGISHAMVLAFMFGLIYLILRVMFDKMVPGNVRFPAVLDKVGGAAMGLVAGVFAAGIVAMVGQYMPMMPAVAGYARYATDATHEVTLPSIAGQRMVTSAVWHELKSNKPGQFEEKDQGGLIIPADDIVVKTVNHLSDGGSLAGRQPLAKVHPDLLQEIFAQRLGIQTGATRVITNEGVQPVELFHTAALKFRDHEYKKLRTIDTKGMPVKGAEIRPASNQMLLIVRLTFTRFGGDSDHWVRFSPGSARLVTHAPNRGEGEMVNNFPIGTVDAANLLYLNKPDDFLLAKDDAGVDFAYLIDRSAVVEGAGQGRTLKVRDGTFFEFKRMAREDLSGKSISGTYKKSDTVHVERKQIPEGDEAPKPAPTAGTPTAAPTAAAGNTDELKQRLVGNWAGTSDTGQLVIDFAAEGTLKINSTPKSGVPVITTGTWEVIRAEGDNTLIIKRTLGGRAGDVTITFNGNDSLTLVSATTPQPITLMRR